MNPEYQGTFFFDPEDPIYREHFPGNPVVPGSVIIRAFMMAAPVKVRMVKDFRFRKFISPGEYAFRIADRGGYLDCRLFQGGSAVAVGKLEP